MRRKWFAPAGDGQPTVPSASMADEYLPCMELRVRLAALCQCASAK